MKNLFLLPLIIIVLSISCKQDVKDTGSIKSYDKTDIYKYHTIKTSLGEIDKPEGFLKKFKLDVANKNYPNKVSLYTSYWRNNPISQGMTGMCWSFGTTSFFESEIKRLSGKEVKLSELFTVYWEYVEKAKLFMESKGQTKFDQGSEPNAVTRMYKKYGIVPLNSYTGLLDPQQKFHSHGKMYKKIKSYLQSLKDKDNWENASIDTIKNILNSHIGNPPTEITIADKVYTPKEYLANYLKLNMDDYVDIYSILEEPFYEKVIYNVPDNWWKSKKYYNVPLKEYIETFKNVIKNGYTASIGGDTSESGICVQKDEPQTFVIPTFDIPSEYIDDYARQHRFSNKSTTDDHIMHAVGYVEWDNGTWFLVKDSGSGSRNNDIDEEEFGYYFFHEDYIKLKIMSFTVHKDAVKDILAKFE